MLARTPTQPTHRFGYGRVRHNMQRSNPLFDYLSTLDGLRAYWPLDDASGALARCVHPAVALGRNICLNGTFAADATWTKGTNWTIAAGVATATAVVTGQLLSQAIVPMAVGKSFEVTFTVSGFIAGSVRPQCGSTGLGTSRTADGTYTETIVCAGSTTFAFNCPLTFTGNIDNVTIKQVNIPAGTTTASPMAGTVVGATVNVGTNAAINKCYSFDGVNDSVAIYSPELNSVMDGDEGTLLVFAKVSAAGVWADGATRAVTRLGSVDTTTEVIIRKEIAASSLFTRRVTSSTKSVTQASFAPTEWFMPATTWSVSGNAVKFVINGVQSGSDQTSPAVWADNIGAANTMIGVRDNGNNNPFSGFIAHVAVFNRPLTIAELLRAAQLGGVA